MSIATAITSAQGKVADAYTAVSNKGGTLPETQNLSNLPTAINSIQVSSGSVDIPQMILDHERYYYPLLFSGNSHGDMLPTQALNVNNSVTVTSGTYTLWSFDVARVEWTLLATITL